ncbi:hypothetical protein KRM28CT15_26220 [Krasilnikovia sp. M28-CT-15]
MSDPCPGLNVRSTARRVRRGRVAPDFQGIAQRGIAFESYLRWDDIGSAQGAYYGVRPGAGGGPAGRGLAAASNGEVLTTLPAPFRSWCTVS